MSLQRGAYKNTNKANANKPSLWQMYQSYRSENEQYLKAAMKDRQYYLGNHYSKDELRKLKKRGQAPSTVNYAYSMVYTQMSIMLARTPRYKAIARDDNDVKKTHLINDIMSYIHYVSDGDMQIRAAAENMLVAGRGQMGVYWDPNSDEGKGDVKFESLPMDEVFWDPKAKKRYGQDSRYIFRTKTIDMQAAMKYYPQYKNLIHGAASSMQSKSGFSNPNPATTGTIWGTDHMSDLNRQGDRKINLTNAYGKEYQNLYTLIGQGGKPLAKDIPAEKIQQVTYQLTSQGAKIVTYRQRTQTNIIRHLMLGPYTAFSEKLDCGSYPIVPFCNMWTGNMFPFGDIRQIRPLIDEANKIRSLRIHNMATSTNGKLIARKGLFDKENQAEQNMARPGSISYVNSVGDDIRKDIMPVNTQAVSPESFAHEQQTSQNIKQVTGVYEMMQGGSSHAPDTYRGILAFDEYGQRKINYKLKNFNLSLSRIGNVALRLAQKKYPQGKIVRVVQPQWNSREEKVRYKKINIPVFDKYSGEVLRMANDISVGKYDVIIKGGSTLPSNRWAEQQAYKEDYQMGIIDDVEYIKKTDIYDRQGLLERKGIYSQQKKQLDHLSEAIKKLQENNDSLNSKLQQSQKELELAKTKADYELASQQAKFENKWNEKKNDINMYIDRKKAQLDYREDEQNLEYKLKEAIEKYKIARLKLQKAQQKEQNSSN